MSHLAVVYNSQTIKWGSVILEVEWYTPSRRLFLCGLALSGGQKTDIFCVGISRDSSCRAS